ncbi:hypothetical protein I3843_13G109400 [Carya illinoinensis]|nr:hypothetical protein I3843_13G109400 [Carya illinoinensis]KAG7950381.1 hypothetical protein I3843_13G109400 [Carya illinoinensis]KAG7950382.1 hypothetical protein I3843_13G109400 [Carya illinoinensis]KAG7950383.1 hypothetical protein I3843_13G109400 [Carya illinoinensis]KAG7950384.1 hypothetical protein I3843_13G109400 [Carya illinoinensis]
MMMASEGSKPSQSSLTPRKINVKKFTESRGPELEALHSIVADRLNNNFGSRRNKRRRTTAFNNQVARKRCRRRQKGGEVNKDGALEKDDQKKVPRHVRRRVELRMNPETGFCTSGDGTKRLRTHVWHTKRFIMSKLWGFYLPLGLQGRGRGSRAVLKWFKQGVLVHDASYHVAVQLEGPEDSLMSVLKMVMVPSPSALSEAISHSVISGSIYGSAMLRHVGAPVSQSIAPVTYMWRSVCQESRCGDAMNHNSDGGNRSESSGCCSSSRQIWVWIHVSAVSEGLDALKLACQKEMDERGCLINCFSLEGQLAKLEVSGLKAFQLLQKILHPVTCFSEKSQQLKKHSAVVSNIDSQFKKASVPENEDDFCTRAILSLRVWDPRIASETRTADVPKSLSTGMSSAPEAEAKELAASERIVDKNRELLLSFWSKPEQNGIIHNNDLWESSSGVSPPVEESILCMEKHRLRMENFCLDASNFGMLNTPTKVQCSRSCPIMLLKNNDPKGLFIGWSIVLPVSWVKAFWAPLVSKGAHAIGLREKHWIACEMGLPFFPLDFPDCNAYSCFMATENVASTKKAERCPPDVRPWKVPIPPPWDTIRLAFNKGPRTVGNRVTYNEEDIIDRNSLAISNFGNNATSVFVHHSNSFDGMVARTCFMLTDFLREIQGDHLLLFPQLPDHKTSIFKLMKDESMFGLSLKGVTESSYNRKLCFVRVILHAYKEGVFEEGAVVCAPQLTDVSLFISRQGNDKGGLQMPQSAVRSYFKEQSSAKWELHIPEDVAREVHRWPIGFVTTGFVRGSKKPAAEALCEAVLLAHLREEQWKNMSTKQRKEIYVLVRNLRSSSYRLALATIVLERHDQDVEFM